MGHNVLQHHPADDVRTTWRRLPVARWRGRDAQDSHVAQRVRPVSSGCYEHGSATPASKASTTTAGTRVENRHVPTSSRTPRDPSKRDPQGGLVNASHFGFVARRCCAHPRHPHPPPRAPAVAKHVVVDTDLHQTQCPGDREVGHLSLRDGFSSDRHVSKRGLGNVLVSPQHPRRTHGAGLGGSDGQGCPSLLDFLCVPSAG